MDHPCGMRFYSRGVRVVDAERFDFFGQFGQHAERKRNGFGFLIRDGFCDRYRQRQRDCADNRYVVFRRKQRPDERSRLDIHIAEFKRRQQRFDDFGNDRRVVVWRHDIWQLDQTGRLERGRYLALNGKTAVRTAVFLWEISAEDQRRKPRHIEPAHASRYTTTTPAEATI
jgi:hypothetical protein